LYLGSFDKYDVAVKARQIAEEVYGKFLSEINVPVAESDNQKAT